MQYKKISDVMTYNVTVVSPDESVEEAAEKMRALDVGSFPVCNGEKVVGVITDRDIAIRAVADGSHPSETKVKDIMTPEIVYVFEDQDILEAARLMELKQIRRLIVLDRSKQLKGIVSLGDISLQQQDRELSGEILREVSEPHKEELEV